jgi:hypothetical protein
VAGHFGVCRGLAEGGDKEFRPTMHRKKSELSRPLSADEVQMTAGFILNVGAIRR